jgi:hypothetical protein
MKEREHPSEERLVGLFQPDTLLPSQYLDRTRRRTEHDGERRLMIAVLDDAVHVYRTQLGARDGRARQLFREAEQWIEDTDRSWLFSFENVCDILGLDAEYLRRGLRALRDGARAPSHGQVYALQRPAAGELRRASGD